MPGAFLHPFAKPTRERFITIARGEGALVWDDDGNELIDAMASLWYYNVGHGRGEIADAVARQIREIEAYSCFDPFTNRPADALAERITDLTPMPDARVFFAGSGSEAIDTAMKLCRLSHALAGHPERHLIISRERGYHGTNYGGTSAQGLAPNKEGYGTLLHDVVQVPSDDIEALSVLMSEREGEIAAVLTEPIQGAAGVYPPTEGYLAEARRLCDQHGAFLIFDEVITGFGRLGAPFAAEYFGVTPDIMITAKGLTNGVIPMGAVFVKKEIYEAFMNGPEHLIEFFHGYTYSGNPVASAAGLATLETYKDEGLLTRAAELDSYWADALHSLKGLPHVIDIRNLGLIGAIELEPIAGEPTKRAFSAFLEAFDRGVLIRTTGDIIALSPPLIIEKGQIDHLFGTLTDVLKGLN
jgi:beta-alanine--pyruvate transaminase